MVNGEDSEGNGSGRIAVTTLAPRDVREIEPATVRPLGDVVGSKRTYEGESITGTKRYFSKPESSPYDAVKWTETEVPIVDDQGGLLFTQRATFPEFYTGLARKVVASRYFYGERNTPQREISGKQLIERVTETYGQWALRQGYVRTAEEADTFRDELAWLALHQAFAWNSPVWFNVGTDRYEDFKPEEQRDGFVLGEDGTAIRRPVGTNNEYPQTSACFIQSVDDTMEDIMDLAVREAQLFRHGSGTGTNLSSLRSSREKISGGGTPSGPLAYLAFYDKVAGIVKSGGRNRRAAKMDILDIDHPDIKEFITAKRTQQTYINALMDFLGVSYRDAADSALYQNANLSIRVTDEFMKAVKEGRKWRTRPVHNKDMEAQMPEYDAIELWKEIARCSWACADPGLQFDTEINRWHTTPRTARIRASNPCSEYMQMDDTSCNLASVNIMSFAKEDGSFEVERFEKAIDLLTVSMDLNYDASSFPTPRIAEKSGSIRPLGVGYTNLGSWLMFMGLPYDSHQGRQAAKALTALMTGQTYLTSTRIAERVGPFPEYEKNKEETLKVLRMHREELGKVDRASLPKGLETILDEAHRVWNETIERAELYGVRNAQATVLAPTGTISFQMDADTLGIEPDLGLVKYKTLAEGGKLRIVNRMVPIALRRLGYEEDQIHRIVEHIAGHEDITKTPGLKPEHFELARKHKSLGNLDDKLKEAGYKPQERREIMFYVTGHETAEGSEINPQHLAVFDCASKPTHGTRYISPEGHIEMMSAVQPFLSGAISKTVNLPREATVEDVERIHMMAWERGLKSVALYRDNCKRGQPLGFGTSNFENEAAMIEQLRKRGVSLEDHVKPVRKKLPITRGGVTHKLAFGDGHEAYIQPGFYPRGDLGELFINMSTEGSMVRGITDMLAVAISLGLQYGVPPSAYIHKFQHQKFDPRGIMMEGDPEIKTVDSFADYLSQYLAKVTDPERRNQMLREAMPFLFQGLVSGKNPETNGNNGENGNGRAQSTESRGGPCPACGSIMIRKGNCLESCPKCSFVDPKGCGQ